MNLIQKFAGATLLAGATFLTGCQKFAEVYISSEPSKARVYESGQFIGTTPFSKSYGINENHFGHTIRLHPTLAFYKDGFLPQKSDILLDVPSESEWGGRLIRKFYALAELQRDPNGPKEVIIHQTNRTEDSTLDTLNKGMDAASKGLMLESLIRARLGR